MKKALIIVVCVIIGLYSYHKSSLVQQYLNKYKSTRSTQSLKNNIVTTNHKPINNKTQTLQTKANKTNIELFLFPFQNQATGLKALLHKQTTDESAAKLSSSTSLMDSSNYSESNGKEIKILLISDYTNNQIVKCIFNPNSTFKCSTFIENIQAPEEILLIANNLFIVGMDSQTLYICDLSSDPNEDIQCNTTPLSIAYPSYMYYNLQYLYVSDFGAKHVIRCGLDSGYNVTSCVPNTESINKAYFNSAIYQDKFYIPNYALNSIDQCNDLNSDLDCNHLTDSLIIHPLANTVFDDRFYLINTLSETSYNISECRLNQQNQFTGCRVVIDDIAMPISIVGVKISNPPND